MQYGFVIDHDSCIGCHACTVACKAENDVPVGNFRTAVKYVEAGQFPDVKRHFAVQRCNHCTDAPCVTICPVNALEKRPDGIVDIDRDACIGCRACIQACPYDAIYLNEDLGAVEKCHFCAHRKERGLEPACVTVCPVEAIIPGDFDDPDSRVSQLTVNGRARVRRPEQGTGPNVRYLGIHDLALQPGAAARPDMYLWSDRPPQKPEAWPETLPLVPDAAVVLDTGHRVEWGWGVAGYLVTKGIAAGCAMLAPFVMAMGLRPVPEIIALVFTLITCGLLVEDLARPLRFYRLITRPNWESWLVRGGVVLGAFIGLLAVSIGLHYSGADGAARIVRWLAASVGIGTAGYTAMLFAQCKGRDLWESRLLLPHLLAQALLCGAACLLPFAPASTGLAIVFAVATIAHVVLSLMERYRAHETGNARQAAAFLGTITLGPLKPFRDGLLLGSIAGGILLFVFPPAVFVPALIGLLLFEHAYMRAAQLPPLS